MSKNQLKIKNKNEIHLLEKIRKKLFAINENKSNKQDKKQIKKLDKLLN